MSLYAFYQTVLYIFTALFGVCVGSFLNVVIYRVPNGMSIANPPSHCPVCDSYIKWYDNIPVLSYLFLKGKCRNCKTHISFRYTIVEIANALLWILSVWLFWKYSVAEAIIVAFTMSVLICVFFIDLENMIIPDRFNIILLALGIAYTAVDSVCVGTSAFLLHLIGGIAGFVVFFLIGYLGEKIKHTEVMGGGDIKLSAVMGLYMGWPKLILAVLIASVLGAVVMSLAMRNEKNKDKMFPFAPFLATGFAIAILFGDMIINSYLNLLL